MGVGCDISYRRLNGNGKFDIWSYNSPITIRFGVHLSPIFLGRMFGKLRLCLVTVFVFYFQKLVFGNIKINK